MKKDRPDAEPEKVAELHGLAQYQPAHQSAQDMLSNKWANAPWATALSAHLSQPDAQYASQHTAGKPVADSSHTPPPPGRGTPQNSKPADNAISRPGVVTRIPNALFMKAPEIIKAVPRQVSSRAASWLSKPTQQVQLSELGQNSKASFGSAAQQQPAAGSASLAHPLLPGSKAATGPVSTAALPGSAAAVSVPLLPTEKAAGGEITAPLLATGKAAAATGPEAVSAPLLPAGKGDTGAASAPLLPTGQAAAAAVNAAPVPHGFTTAVAVATPVLPAGKAMNAAATAPVLLTGKAAPTAPLLPSSRSAAPSFMRPCSKPWGVNKGGRAGGLSKTQGVPRGAKGSKGTGAAQREKLAKTGAMPKQARITGSQTRHDSLTDPPPPRSSSSVPAATHPASPQSAAQQNLSHGLSPPKLDQLSSELPLKQSVSHPPAMTHPPAVTHPPTASAQQPPANAAPPRSSLKLPSQLPPQLPSQLPSQLPPATEAPACSNDEKEVQQWHDLQKQKADALMAKVLSTRTGDRSGKDLTDEELAQFQSQLLEQAREEAKKLPDRLHPAKPPPCPRNLPPPPKQAAHHLPNPLQLELVRVDPLQPYNCREPPQRFSSLAGALQLITKGVVNPVAVHAAAALHARGATILHRRKYESLDAAVFWVVLKECRAKPTNKQYADALLKATRNKVCASTISSGAKMLSDDSAFVSALKTELSRLTEQPKRTAKEISSSPVTVSKPGPMPSSKSTKRSREDNPADLSRESAHMGPHVTSAGQEATKLSSAADEESPRPENKKMCFGVGQPSSGAVSQVGDSSKHAGDYNTICGDLANDAAIAGVPFNPTSGHPSSIEHTQTQEEDQMMMDASVAVFPSDFGNMNDGIDINILDIPIPMPSKEFQAQYCPTWADQAQPLAMQGVHMIPWPVQDSQAQLPMPHGYQGQPLSAQGHQAQPLPAQGCPAQLQGILTGKAEGSAELFNRALADWLEPDTPEQFEAELFGSMFGPPPAS